MPDGNCAARSTTLVRLPVLAASLLREREPSCSSSRCFGPEGRDLSESRESPSSPQEVHDPFGSLRLPLGEYEFTGNEPGPAQEKRDKKLADWREKGMSFVPATRKPLYTPKK